MLLIPPAQFQIALGLGVGATIKIPALRQLGVSAWVPSSRVGMARASDINASGRATSAFWTGSGQGDSTGVDTGGGAVSLPGWCRRA
ncbi:hypothetical protein AU14_18975 [Marinobacter similis]|uniref:Uncharacterized protein n=1 Tax=Marinobacter similis TaxID=1420916 RepID=W5YN31_9GAMM|nr:hypothetical protein AU14_18975 [Marinobacter similis]